MNGIDISHHQGSIDFKKVAADSQKIEFVIIKASQGVGFIDPEVGFNSNKAKAAGLRIGYYHFASLNSTDVVKDSTDEANYFLGVIKSLPLPDLPLILDIETNDKKLSPPDVFLWIQTFLNVLKVNGHPDVVLYSYTPFLNDNLPSNHSFGNIKLWIAGYQKKVKIPKGWANYWLWQYTDKGKVNGINSNVDMNKSLTPIF